MALLSTQWWQLQNEIPLPSNGSCSRGGAKVLMTTSPSTWAPFPSLRQVPSAGRQTPSPSAAFLPSQHRSHKSAVKCCLSAYESSVSRTPCSSSPRTPHQGNELIIKVLFTQELKKQSRSILLVLCSEFLIKLSLTIMLPWLKAVFNSQNSHLFWSQ